MKTVQKELPSMSFDSASPPKIFIVKIINNSEEERGARKVEFIDN
jgi:hypothetical protein